MERRLLTPDEVASRLQISRLTVISHLRSGALKGIKVGRLWRVSEEDLAAFLRASGPRDWQPVRDAASVQPYADKTTHGETTAEAISRTSDTPNKCQDVDIRWLEADLGGPLPPYDWGPKGVPFPTPVRYVPGVGLVIERGRRREK